MFIELPQYDCPSYRQIRTQFFVKLLGIKHAFGWKLSQTFIFRKHQERHISFDNERDRLLKILQENNLDILGHYYPLGINTEIKDRIHKLLMLNNALDKGKNIGLVICDEAHLLQYEEVIQHFQKAKLLTVSATFSTLKKVNFTKCHVCQKIHDNIEICCNYETYEYSKKFSFLFYNS